MNPTPPPTPTPEPSPGPYPGYPGYPGYPAPPPFQRTNPIAVAALICSLAGIVTGFSAVAGIVLGHVALNQIRQTGEKGRELAIAGLALGYAITAFLVLALVAAIVIFAIVMPGITISTAG